MDRNLTQINTEIYALCGFDLTDFKTEPEGKAYDACRFKLNGLHIRCRNAKITPTKTGQFVTFWKRNGHGSIEPFHATDQIDFYIVNVRSTHGFGQFVFPKSVLIEKGIISTEKKEGKRAFRVYPKWDVAKNKQAERTQKWQLDYFYPIDAATDLTRVSQLYQKKQ